MRSIIKKSARAIWRNKKAYGACIAVLSIGMMIFICMLSVMAQMENGVNKYYDETNFAHVFAEVRGIPESKLKKLAETEGVAGVQGVLSRNLKVLIQDAEYIVKIKLVGVDTPEETYINQYAYEGYPLNNKKDIWIGEEFFEIYGMEAGETITLQVNGKEEKFNINGTVSSPEYIYIVEENSAMSNPEAYTIGFIQKESLEELLSMEGIVTDIGFLLKDGYRYEDVENPLRQQLESYGLTSLVKREKQASNDSIMGEINELTVIGTILPLLFLSASIIMMYIMLKRMVEQERGEIGTLKAFGFKNYEILAGYLLNGVICGVFAYIIGAAGAVPFGSFIYDMYRSMYSLPEPVFQLSGEIAAIGFFLSLGVSVLAAWLGAFSILKIHPAEAMRPAAPNIQYSSMNLNHQWIGKILRQKGKMILRGMSRNKLRTGLTIVCIAFAFAMINVIFAMGDSVAYLIDGQTSISEVYDIKVSVEGMQGIESLRRDALGIEGVTNAEGMLAMPVTLSHENKQETVAIYGIEENSDLFKIRNTAGDFYNPPKEGILLNTSLAEKLGIQAGDFIETDSMYLKDKVRIMVTEVFQEPMGAGCYMEIGALSAVFDSKTMANYVLLEVAEGYLASVQSYLLEGGNITSIVNQRQVEQSNKSMMESLNIMIYMFAVMSFLMALGAIYSIARITLTEKQRELATMRILGFSAGEVSQVHTYEQWILFGMAVLFGFIPALILKDYIAGLFNNDYYTMQINLTLNSNLFAVLGCGLAMYLTNRIAKKEIAGYELASVLKERE